MSSKTPEEKLNDFLARKDLEGTPVTCCKGFSHEDELRGKLISLTRTENAIVLRSNIGSSTVFESSIPIENLNVGGKKKTVLFDAYQNRGNVWFFGL